MEEPSIQGHDSEPHVLISLSFFVNIFAHLTKASLSFWKETLGADWPSAPSRKIFSLHRSGVLHKNDVEISVV